MATFSSVLAWRIPGTREPGGLPSVGPHRVVHGCNDVPAAAAAAASVLGFAGHVVSATTAQLLQRESNP